MDNSMQWVVVRSRSNVLQTEGMTLSILPLTAENEKLVKSENNGAHGIEIVFTGSKTAAFLAFEHEAKTATNEVLG